jgi:hypothetical protein
MVQPLWVGRGDRQRGDGWAFSPKRFVVTEVDEDAVGAARSLR